MEKENNIFHKFSCVTDDDEDFEIGELDNFNLDMIAVKPKKNFEVCLEEFSEESLLENSDNNFNINEEHDLKSIFKHFEN